MKKFEEKASNKLDHRPLKCACFTNPKDKVILDIGSSFGWYEKYAIKNGCKKIYGIEPEDRNLKKAQKAVPEAELVKGSAEKIPFKDSMFDLAVMFDVIEHLPKNTESKALKEIYRVLKHGGEFVLSTPNQNFLSNLLDPSWYFGHRHYSKNQLQNLFKKNGLKITEVQYGGGFFEEIGVLIFYIFKWVFRRQMPRVKWFEKLRENEFKDRKGSMTIFVKAIKE